MSYMKLSPQGRDPVPILYWVCKIHFRFPTKEQNQFASIRKGSPSLRPDSDGDPI